MRAMGSLLVILTLTAVTPLAGQGTADSLAARGDSALGRGDAAAAAEAFAAALRLRPNEPSLLQRLGRALRDLGKLTEALERYEQAIAADSAFAPAYAGRAFTRHLLQDSQGALTDVAHARALGMADPQLALIAGMALGREGRFAESERELDAFVAAVPDEPAGWYFRGLGLGQQGKHAAALEDFNRAEQAGMTVPQLYMDRGIAHGQLGHQTAACADLRRAADGGIAEAKKLVGERCR